MPFLGPIELPETRAMIIAHLTWRDLAHCVRVCRLWYPLFMPLLLSVLKADHFIKLLPAMQDPRGGEKPRDNDKRITFSFKALLGSPQFFDLHALHISDDGNQSLTTAINHQLPRLSQLPLTQFALPLQLIPIWKSIFFLQNLTQLELNGLTIHEDGCHDLWNLCSQLESLSLLKCTIRQAPFSTDKGKGTALLGTSKLRNLTLQHIQGLTKKDQGMIVAHFPQLKSLFWFWYTRSSAITTQNAAEQSTWPGLQNLELWAYASDTELSIIIGKMKQATVLRLTNSEFGSRSFSALQPHFPWLKTLSITDSVTTSAPFIPTVLTSCSRLEMLVADGVFVQDLLGDSHRPWACNDSLKVLELFFETTVVGPDVEQKQQEEQDYVFERLSELRNLESLIVGPPNRWVPMRRNQPTLDFRLEKGLERLATLTRLTHLDFLATEQAMTTAEAEWMIDHWVSLEQATGVFNQDSNEDDRVRVLLYEAGIAVSNDGY